MAKVKKAHIKSQAEGRRKRKTREINTAAIARSRPEVKNKTVRKIKQIAATLAGDIVLTFLF